MMHAPSLLVLSLCWVVCFSAAAQSLTSSSTHEGNDHAMLCSLCGTDVMPQEKLGAILFATTKEGAEQELITSCEDLELFEVDNSQEGQQLCSSFQQHYQQICCSPDIMENEKLFVMENVHVESASLRGHRAIWEATGNGITTTVGTTAARMGSSYNSYASPASTTVHTLSAGSSQYCSDNRYASNDVKFSTAGGACMCPVCVDNRSEGYLNPSIGATFYVPGGATYSNKNCIEMNSIGLGGYLTNGYCNIFQKSLVECCQ